MRTTNVASVDFLEDLEYMIYGNLAKIHSSFGEDLKYVEYGKIYKYQGKYYRAYKELAIASGIYEPDDDHFMQINLADLSTPLNKITEIEEGGGMYLPPYTTLNTDHLRVAEGPTEVFPIKTDFYGDTSYIVHYKQIHPRNNFSYDASGRIIDDKGLPVDLDKYIISSLPLRRRSNNGLYIKIQEIRTIKQVKGYKLVPKQKSNWNPWWMIGGFLLGGFIGGIIADAVLGHQEVPDGYEEVETMVDKEFITYKRVWVDDKGNYVRDFNDQTDTDVTEDKPTYERDYVSPEMVPVLSTIEYESRYYSGPNVNDRVLEIVPEHEGEGEDPYKYIRAYLDEYYSFKNEYGTALDYTIFKDKYIKLTELEDRNALIKEYYDSGKLFQYLKV